MAENPTEIRQKNDERRIFLFICVFFAPIVSVALIGGYGFFIWLLQMIFGPPGT